MKVFVLCSLQLYSLALHVRKATGPDSEARMASAAEYSVRSNCEYL